MSKVENFEDLRIWQEARVFVKEIYSDFETGTGAIVCRDYSFRDQIQKAGISIMNNIAEGFERLTDADFARFLDVAKGSCGEVRSMYYSAEDLNYVTHEIAVQRRQKAKRISGGIAGLTKHLRHKMDA